MLLPSALLAFTALLTLPSVFSKSHVKVHLSVPSLIQCEPATLHWSGGKPPFRVWAQPDSRDPGTVSEIVSNGTEYTATWLVDAPAGSRVKIRLVDGIGHWTNSYSVIHIGEDSSCLNLDYPNPTAPASHPPPPKSGWVVGHAYALLLALLILSACVAIAVVITKREKAKDEDEVKGEYLPVSADIQLSHLGGKVTRRSPTHTLGDDDEEEYHRLLSRRDD